MRLPRSGIRRVVIAALVASAGSALLAPLAARSREIERRAELLNSSFEPATPKPPAAAARMEGTPREVFAWLRQIEMDPPRERFRVELAIESNQASATRLVAEVHPGRRENRP